MSSIGPNLGGYAFVNSYGPEDAKGRKAKSIIRRHAMKDIGQARRKRPRHTIVQLELLPESSRPPKLYALPSHSTILGMDLDENDLRLAHFVRAQGESKYHPFRTVWVQIGLSDQTAFYLSMATAVHFHGHVKANPEDEAFPKSEESARYYSKAMNQLAHRLKDPKDCVSPGIVATILGCLCHDSHLGNWQQWAVHMAGLQHLSQLRGGLQSLECQMPLMAFWLDLVGSAFYDAPPWFSIPPDMPLLGLGLASEPLESVLRDVEDNYTPSSWLVSAMRSVSELANTVNANSESPAFWQDEIGAIQMLGPITHGLLSAPREPNVVDHNGHDQAPVFEMTRLACLLLLSSLKGKFSLSAGDFDTLGQRFVHVATQRRHCSRQLPIIDLELWALVTASILLPEAMIGQLMLSISHSALSRGLSHADPVIEFAKSMIWIDCLQRLREKIWKQGFESAMETNSSLLFDAADTHAFPLR